MRTVALACLGGAAAFAPARSGKFLAVPSRSVAPRSSRSVTQMMLPDLLLAADALSSGVVDAASGVADAAAAVPVDDGGWFGSFVNLIEYAIKALHGLLGEGSYGVTIILFTLLIKGITFPLNYVQIESTTKMQALGPAIKRIQAKYANDPQQMNMMMSQLYQENDLNPLAGCLPAFAQIPIFIAFYRSVLALANDNLLTESFLWLPNLEGPTYGATTADWLFAFGNWEGTTPPLGWHDTLCYLAFPVLLVLSQSVSAELLKPPPPPGEPTDQMAQTNAALKFLPLLIGFFSLNVPSGLTLYWFVNNIFTTVSTLYIRNTVSAVTMGGETIVEATAAAPPTTKKAKATTFNDMLGDTKAPSRPSSQAPVIDATIVESAVTTDADLNEELSKAAEKKKAKAVKTRRSKKSRK